MSEADLATWTSRHEETLRRAVTVLMSRENWSPHSEDPTAYGDGSRLGDRLDKPFRLEQRGVDGTVPAGEFSPFGFSLGVTYEHVDPDALLPAMDVAARSWRDASPERRAVVCAEMLQRINARSDEFALAAGYASGHNEVMALHAGAIHAQDRGLEAVACALLEQTRLPRTARWSKKVGDATVHIDKTFRVVPRGIGVLIGNGIFPAWSGYPGLFASLATGNAVVVKPHPNAVLPLALTVEVAREVLGEAGYDRDVVCLAPEYPGEQLAARLATHPLVGVVDHTGRTGFGRWLERTAEAAVFTAGSAVNCLLIESTDDYAGMLANIAFTMALYSGQLCTTPRVLLVPRSGIETESGHRTHDQVVADLCAEVTGLLSDDTAASAVLGALTEEAARVVERAGELGEILLPTREVRHPDHPAARVRTPVVVRVSERSDVLFVEHFGPVYLVTAVESVDSALSLIGDIARRHGSLSLGAYSTCPDVDEALQKVSLQAGVLLSLNLRGQWYVTQSAVFSDRHGTGMNPASNVAFCESGFVSSRFRVVETRRYAG